MFNKEIISFFEKREKYLQYQSKFSEIYLVGRLSFLIQRTDGTPYKYYLIISDEPFTVKVNILIGIKIGEYYYV